MEFDEFKELMVYYGNKSELMFNEEQLVKFFNYMNLLLKWNKNVNLTAITKPEEVILKHFIDSLTINKYIEINKSIADLGTGAGFPGIPLIIYREDLKITLVDSLNKRINFLNQVISELKLNNVQTIHSRIEDFGRDKKYREKFDYVTARAVANLSTLSEYMIPVCKVNGKCICMKGNNIEEEIKNSERAIKILGGVVKEKEKFMLADTNIERNIIVIYKKENTPNKYPRKAGVPGKEPLS